MGLGLALAAFRPGSVGAVPLSRLPAGLAAGDPAAFLNLGLVSLMSTPVARVAASVVAYLAARDWPFFAVTVAVFLLLLLSLSLGVG